ncbi:MAG: hypothetical protein J6D21_01545 [Clostridia bacterium]|nr:hypothetical protein [Clostridia bacterium]
MDFLKFFSLSFYISLFWQFVFYLGGFLLYKAGSHKLGHKMVAMGICGDFGMCKKTRKWLSDHCPYSSDEQPKCCLWTCPRYEECKKLKV